jgi:hypothetical protein
VTPHQRNDSELREYTLNNIYLLLFVEYVLDLFSLYMYMKFALFTNFIFGLVLSL